MPRSTASFLAYDLRPAKQTERRILLDYLKTAGECGVAIQDYRYVGMGGFKFYDFLMMYRYAGMRLLYSVEHDPKMVVRAEFNRPLAIINVVASSIRDFVISDNFEGRTTYWLDYDSSLNDDVIKDAQALGIKAKPGAFLFITVASELPDDLREKNEEQRLADWKEQFGALADDVDIRDVEDNNFELAVYKVLEAALRNAFAARLDSRLVLNFRVSYTDSMKMLTVGGHFFEAGKSVEVTRRIKKRLPFLDGGEVYQIRSMNLSERERHLIEFASTKRRGSREEKKLRSLGIKSADLEAYRTMVRFLPRYFETVF